MIKEYMELTPTERRFRDVTRQVCLPLIQAEIYEDLNAEERKILEAGTAEDVDRMRQTSKEKHVAFQECESNNDWLLGNGLNNISRLADYRGVTAEKLALDFALEYGLLNGRSEHNRLIRKCIGEDTQCPAVAIKFIDNELLVNGKAVCSVRSSKNSKLDYILRSFDESNWKTCSINFSERYEDKQIADAVLSLNRKQKAIKFTTSLGSIKWQLLPACNEN